MMAVSRIEDLANRTGRHIAVPWQRTIAGAQRVIMAVYDNDAERMLRARKDLFRLATEAAGKEWAEVDLTDCFGHWLADDEYCEDFFRNPGDVQLALDDEFPRFVADRIRVALRQPTDRANAVVGVFGVGALFGFARISQIIKLVEPEIEGRLLIFFPGSLDASIYRMFDAGDGWNYLAVPISLAQTGG
jgi:hypothetical protein